MSNPRLQTFWSTAVWYLGGAAAIQAVNFAAQPLFAFLMTPAELGIATNYLLWMTAFGLLIGFQAQAALNNVRTTYGDAALSSYITTVLPWYAVPFGVLLLTLVAAPGLWSRAVGLQIGYLHLALVNGVLFAALAMAMGHALTLGRRRSYVTISIASTVIPLALGLVLVLAMPEDRALGRVLGYALGAAGVVLVVAVRALRGHRRRGPRPGVVHPRLLVFGLAIVLPLLLHELLYLVMNQSNRAFLLALVDAEAAGVFAFAFGIGNISVVAATAVNSSWTPWYFTHTKAGEHERVRRTGAELVVLFGAAIGALALVSPEGLRAITREAYWDGALVVPALVVSGHLLLVFNVSANYAIYRQRTRLVLLLSSVGCVLNVVLNLTLIPRWEIVGAAVASLAATGWLAISMTLTSRFLLGSPNLPSAAMMASLGLSGGCLAVAWLGFDHPWLRAGLAAVVLLLAAGHVARRVRGRGA